MKVHLGSKPVTFASLALLVGAIMSYQKAPELSTNIIVATGAIAITNELLSKQYAQAAKAQADEVVNDMLSASKKSEIAFSRTNSALIEAQKLANTRQQTIEELQKELQELSLIRVGQSRKIQELEENKNELIRNFENREETLFTYHKSIITQEVRDRLDNHLRHLLSNIETALKTKKMLNLSDKIIEFQSNVYDKIENINQEISWMSNDCESLAELMATYGELYDQVITLKVKWRNLLNIRERDALFSAYDQLQNYVPKDKAIALTREQSQGHRQQLEKVFTSVENNAGEIELLRMQIQDLLDRIEEKNLEILKLKEPMTWRLATRDDLRIGNIIINYFSQQGIILDRATATYKIYESTLSFHIDRNSRIYTPQEFNPHSEKLQQLCHTLTPITFAWNAEEGLLTTTLQLSRKPAKTNDLDVNRLWKTSDKFPQLASKWERVRITGQSQAGKSPTAENLAICMMQGRKDRGKIKLYNPQHDSRKNHFTIPVAGTTHQDSIQDLDILADLINNHQIDRDIFDIYIFDEIDSTLSADETPDTANAIKEIIKQASHQNVGVIFTGQNANAKQYKGFDRSDWNNAVNIHIGANIGDALSNSNQFTTEECNKLKAQSAILTEYCQSKNQELGLDLNDPTAYRFALVIEPGSKPYFIQLPDFGMYTYDLLAVASCPKCGSSNIVGHGTNRKKCRDCNHTFKA
jgi:hypothetical protein